MRCTLCDGARRVVKKGDEEPVDCPRCDGEGEIPTKGETARAIAQGRASAFSPKHARFVSEVRSVLRELAKLFGPNR